MARTPDETSPSVRVCYSPNGQFVVAYWEDYGRCRTLDLRPSQLRAAGQLGKEQIRIAGQARVRVLACGGKKGEVQLAAYSPCPSALGSHGAKLTFPDQQQDLQNAAELQCSKRM